MLGVVDRFDYPLNPNKMMKKALLFFSLLISLGSLAQSNGSLKATYTYQNLDLGHSQEVTLVIKNVESFSVFFDHGSKPKIEKPDDEETVYFSKESADSIKGQFYTNLVTRKIVFREFILEKGEFIPVIVEEDLPEMKWIMTNQEKSVGRFSCLSAEVTFRGRKFIVWFTPEVPTSLGPWKFHGLPGLITEIQTDDQRISFQLLKLENVQPVVLRAPSSGKMISWKSYVSSKNGEVEDYIRNLKTKLPRGATVTYETENFNLEKVF